MKKALGSLAVMVLVLVGIANATPYTDKYDPADDIYLTADWVGGFCGHWEPGDSISWTFNIMEETYTGSVLHSGDYGFDPVTQDIISAEVTLGLKDDCEWCYIKEKAQLDVGVNKFNWEVDSGEISFGLTSLMTLSDTGTIDCILTPTKGDFYFDWAQLDAEGTAGTTPVPIPSALLLLGSGLVGLASFRKRFKR